MSLLEKINAMKMPFAELKGVKFTEADKDRVVAKMVVRPDLCTLYHTIHGGAVMALADCGAAQALAHHNGTFQLTDEAIDAPALALASKVAWPAAIPVAKSAESFANAVPASVGPEPKADPTAAVLESREG